MLLKNSLNCIQTNSVTQMKILLTFALSIGLSTSFAQKSDNQKKCETAINSWANARFVEHEGSRFENFKMVGTPEYEMIALQIQTLKEFREEINFNFNEGKSDRTEEKLKEDISKIDENIAELETMLTSMKGVADHYEYYWWSNIKTDAGVTVYYQHFIKLDANFKVISSEISSYVGKDKDDIKILYK